jgi:ubiquitin-protein ligase
MRDNLPDVADRAELVNIPGVSLGDEDDPLVVNLFYLPPKNASQKEALLEEKAYHFHVTIPQRYPFLPPTWKWISRPSEKSHPCLGPDGLVSVDALSHWTPGYSLSNVLISLFPSCALADQCSSVTSCLWNFKVCLFLPSDHL